MSDHVSLCKGAPLVLLVLSWLVCAPAFADEQRARELFAAGIAATAAEHWDDARRAFEASLTESDKAATRFNLILLSVKQERPLEVARHALAFLGMSDNAEHPLELSRAREALQAARSQLALVMLAGGPAGPESLQIDDDPPELLDGSEIYLLPGIHRLEARWERGGELERVELSLRAGQVVAWPRLIRSSTAQAKVAAALCPATAPLPSVQPAPRESTEVPRRTWPARALATSGAGIAVVAFALYVAAEQSARDLARRDDEARGYPSAADRYQQLTASVTPLALIGGAAMVTGVLLSPGTMRRGSLGWSLASLILGGALLGLGGTLIVRDPPPLGDTPLDRPRREAGSLLLGAALPLVTYGLGSPIVRAKDRRTELQSLLPVRVRW